MSPTDPFGPLHSQLDYIRNRLGIETISGAAVLGSGFSTAAARLSCSGTIPYATIPDFPDRCISGHAGEIRRLVTSRGDVLLFCGRFHAYEGHPTATTTLPVRLAAALGARELLLTNASGGINPSFHAGDLMLISDHINMTGAHPLTGISPPPFLDMSNLYRTDRFSLLNEEVTQSGGTVHLGVLAGLTGPTYETPAEIRMLGLLGADAVSMSTVHEAIAARFFNLRVTGLSLIANKAAGLSPCPLTHQEVLEAAAKAIPHIQLALELLLRSD